MKQVFVSYVYEDKAHRDTLEQWARDGRLGNVQVTGESKDVRQGGAGAIRGHISPSLQGASALLVLVGSDTHNHDWVQYEVAHVQSARKPVFVVRVPGTTGAAPPSARGLQQVTFEPSAIRRALET